MSPTSIVLEDIGDREIAELVQRSRKEVSAEQNKQILDDLLSMYKETSDERRAREIRRAFLTVLERMPAEGFSDDRYARFLAEEVEGADLDSVDWREPDQVVDFCELLYRFETRDETVARRVRDHVRQLLLRALQQFEERDEPEKMFRLLQTAPTTSDVMRDPQLLRLRNRTYLYEMRRVRRNRRRLYIFLALQLFFILVIFPFLFINAENGAIQRTIEETAEVDLPPEGTRTYSYYDGLYWALITGASIGYGDITPVTTMGRFIAAALGVMGVITTGLVAGLILSWITARELR